MNRLLLVCLAALLAAPAFAETLRSIAVSGEGSITVVPDQADVTLSVSETHNAAERARERVEDIIGDVLGALDDAGVAKSDIRSAGTTLQPRYRWDTTTRSQTFEGYTATRDVQVRIADLDDLGTVLEAATRLGVTRISTPRLSSSRANAARREALKSAFDDARAKAELLADAAELELLEPISIDTEPAAQRPPMPVMRMAADAVESGNAPVEPGQMEIRTRIRVVFEAGD